MKKLQENRIKLKENCYQKYYFVPKTKSVLYSNKINKKIYANSFFVNSLNKKEKCAAIYHELGHLNKIGYLLTLFQVSLFLFFLIRKSILISFVILFLFFWVKELYCDYYAKKNTGEIYIIALKKIYSEKSSFFNRFLLHPPLKIRLFLLKMY